MRIFIVALTFREKVIQKSVERLNEDDEKLNLLIQSLLTVLNQTQSEESINITQESITPCFQKMIIKKTNKKTEGNELFHTRYTFFLSFSLLARSALSIYISYHMSYVILLLIFTYLYRLLKVMANLGDYQKQKEQKDEREGKEEKAETLPSTDKPEPEPNLNQIIYTQAELEAKLNNNPIWTQVVQEYSLRIMSCQKCTTCEQVFVDGRVECAAEMKIDPSTVKCGTCTWTSLSQDHKCDKHGLDNAMFKCDSCCGIATYKCSNDRYCARCHASDIVMIDKDFPCPGPDKCSLGMPHPKNLPAPHGGYTSPMFVIGCFSCFAEGES